MDEYGERIFKSIGKQNNQQLNLQFNENKQDSEIISYDFITTDKDLFSPPFLSQKGNAMGAYTLQNLDQKYGKFLFEVRAVNKMGGYIRDIIKDKVISMIKQQRGSNAEVLSKEYQNFLVMPNRISQDMFVLIDILDIGGYNLLSKYSSKMLRDYLLEKITEWFK